MDYCDSTMKYFWKKASCIPPSMPHVKYSVQSGSLPVKDLCLYDDTQRAIRAKGLSCP